MIDLNGTSDYILLFALATALGGIGGLVYELLLSRRGQVGMIEVPHTVQGGRFIDLGVWASVIIGAIAAVAALWIFPPDVKTVVDAAGKSSTTTEYDIVRVVALSLIIGSAGSSFLSALQARALALVKDQEAKQTTAVAQAQLDQVKVAAAGGASGSELAAKVDSAKAAILSLSATSAPAD
jgi:hypothetical protein